MPPPLLLLSVCPCPPVPLSCQRAQLGLFARRVAKSLLGQSHNFQPFIEWHTEWRSDGAATFCRMAACVWQPFDDSGRLFNGYEALLLTAQSWEGRGCGFVAGMETQGLLSCQALPTFVS